MNNTQVGYVQDIDIVMSMYNLIEYGDIYSKTSGQYYWDEPTLDKNQNIIEFTANNNHSILFKFKGKITGKTGNGGKKIEIMVPLKYLSNFWRAIERSLINYEINIQLKWFEKYILVAGTVTNQV